MFGQQVERRLRPVVARVVKHEHDEPVALRVKQLAQELVELRPVLLRVDHVVDLARPVVERAVYAELPVRPGGGDFRTLAAEGPHLCQGWVEMNLTLIEEEEIEAGAPLERPLLRNCRNAFFSS